MSRERLHAWVVRYAHKSRAATIEGRDARAEVYRLAAEMCVAAVQGEYYGIARHGHSFRAEA
jgi:hypothetical protein